MKTKQTENLTAYACFLTFTAIRNCIGYTLCKAKSLFFFFFRVSGIELLILLTVLMDQISSNLCFK